MTPVRSQPAAPLWSEYGLLFEFYGWISSDGSTLVTRNRTGGSGHRIWDLTTGLPVASHSGGYRLTAEVRGRIVSSDGRYLLRSSNGSSLDVVDVITGELLASAGDATVLQTDISDDGRTVAIAEPGRIIVRELPSMAPLDTIRGNATLEGDYLAHALSPDGRLLLRSTDERLTLHDLVERRIIEQVSVRDAAASSCAFVDSGRVPIAFDHVTGQLMFFNRPRRLLDGPSVAMIEPFSVVRSTTGSPVFVTLSGALPDDHDVKVWDARDGVMLASYDLDSTLRWRDVGIGRAAGTLVMVGQDRIAIGDLMTGRIERVIDARYWSNAVFLHSGTELLVAAHNEPPRVVDAANGEPIGVVDLGELTSHIRPSPVESLIASTNGFPWGSPQQLRILDLRTGTPRMTLEVPVGAHINLLTWTPDGAMLAGADERGAVWLRDTATGAVVRQFGTLSGAATWLDFSAAGDRLAVASADSTVRIWNMTTGTLEQTLVGRAAVHSAVLTADGRHAISNGADQRLLRWNLNDGTYDVLDSASTAWSIIRVPRRHWILVSNAHGIDVWDSAGERIIHRFDDPRSWHLSGEVLRVDPTGRFVARVRQGDLAVWSLDDVSSTPDAQKLPPPFRAYLLGQPAAEVARLMVESNSPLDATIDIVDGLGRMVLPALERRVEPGQAGVSIACSTLSAGIYFVRVRAAAHSLALPLIISR